MAGGGNLLAGPGVLALKAPDKFSGSALGLPPARDGRVTGKCPLLKEDGPPGGCQATTISDHGLGFVADGVVVGDAHGFDKIGLADVIQFLGGELRPLLQEPGPIH